MKYRFSSLILILCIISSGMAQDSQSAQRADPAVTQSSTAYDA